MSILTVCARVCIPRSVECNSLLRQFLQNQLNLKFAYYNFIYTSEIFAHFYIFVMQIDQSRKIADASVCFACAIRVWTFFTVTEMILNKQPLLVNTHVCTHTHWKQKHTIDINPSEWKKIKLLRLCCLCFDIDIPQISNWDKCHYQMKKTRYL